jgi:vacuolar-type H+-ATPase subunit E/Vma4
MTSADNKWAWLGDLDVEPIFGDARPRSIEKLLEKKNPVWTALYLAWLREFNKDSVAAFEHVRRVGRKPRAQDRIPYERNLKILRPDFEDFVTIVGELKEFQDDRRGLARRLGRVADKASAKAKDAARSGAAAQVAGRLAGPSAARFVQKAVDKATHEEAQREAALQQAAQQQAAEQQAAQQRAEREAEQQRAAQQQAEQQAAQQRAAQRQAAQQQAVTKFAQQVAHGALTLARSEDLDTYLAMINDVYQVLERFAGGELEVHLAQLTALYQGVLSWRESTARSGEVLRGWAPTAPADTVIQWIRQARESAYYLAWHVDLIEYVKQAEAPHQTVTRIIEQLRGAGANVLYETARPALDEIMRGLDNLYYYAGRALETAAWVIKMHDPAYPADDFQDWGTHQVTGFRNDVAQARQALTEPAGAHTGTPAEGEDELARRYFGKPVSELAAR